jgi:tetratricopeptide (TPR) repeat protein
MSVALANFFAGRYGEAADAADQSLSELADFPSALRVKIAACGLLGRIEEGRACVERLLTVNPDTSVAVIRTYYEAPLRKQPQALENYLKGLRLSGLPEGDLSS